jgi:DNA-binding winged helix-turn-helix (wHTH) protein/tetratricopeptide (TPR) repeat protein
LLIVNNGCMSDTLSVCRIDDLTVDFARRKVFDKNHDVITLSALSFDTLCVLIEASPAVVSQGELVERAWHGTVVSDETVTQRIRLLRKGLRDEGPHHRYIETVRNAGYRLIPPVLAAPQDADRTHKPLLYVIAIVIVAISIGVATWDPGGEPEPAATPDSRTSIPLGPVTAAELADQARALAEQRSEASLRYAIVLYEQALEQEPSNRNLRASLSVALSKAVAWYGDDVELAVRAERLAREALADGAFFAGEAALGFALDAQGKMDPAQLAYERAVALDPTHYGARASLAYLLQEKGRLVEALSHDIIAYQQAPPGVLDVQVAGCLRLLGFHAVASQWLDRMDRLDPDSAHAAPARALDLITRGEIEAGRAVIEDALARGVNQMELYEYQVVLALLDNDVETAGTIVDSIPPSLSHRGPATVWRRVVDATAGIALDEAVDLAATLESGFAGGDTWPGTLLYIALLQAAAGDPEQAIAALLRLDAAGYRDYPWLELLPTLDSVRDDPRYRAIIGHMRADVASQRAQVLSADWLPEELRTSAEQTVSQ